MSTPKLLNSVIQEYALEKLEIEMEYNNEIQGSHYDFKLE